MDRIRLETYGLITESSPVLETCLVIAESTKKSHPLLVYFAPTSDQTKDVTPKPQTEIGNHISAPLPLYIPPLVPNPPTLNPKNFGNPNSNPDCVRSRRQIEP